MQQKYKDIVSVIHIETYSSDQKALKKYRVQCILLKSVGILDLLFIIASLVFDLKTTVLATILAFCIVAVYWRHKGKCGKRLLNILQSKCDPVRFLSFYTLMLPHIRQEKYWEIHFFNVVCALYYAGRFKDSHKVLQVFDKYRTDIMSHFYYEWACAILAYYERNEEELLVHCENLSHIVEHNKSKRVFSVQYEKIQLCSLYLQAEKRGEYYSIYAILSHKGYFPHRCSMLEKVSAHYMMYKAAMGLGEEEAAQEHREFILKNGGTLWVKNLLLIEGS